MIRHLIRGRLHLLSIGLLVSSVILVALTASSPTPGPSSETGSPGCAAFRFSSIRWQKAKHDYNATRTPTVRQRLADRVLKCDTLAGRSRIAVRTLLGPPNKGDRSAGSWRYPIGPERTAIEVDTEYLVVYYSSAGRVQQTTIERG